MRFNKKAPPRHAGRRGAEVGRDCTRRMHSSSLRHIINSDTKAGECDEA